MLEKFLTAVCQPIGLVVIWVFIPLKTIRVKTKDMMVGLDKIPRDFKAPVCELMRKNSCTNDIPLVFFKSLPPCAAFFLSPE